MTFAYIIFAIVLLHIVVGFAWAIYKMSTPSGSSKKSPEKGNDKDATRIS